MDNKVKELADKYDDSSKTIDDATKKHNNLPNRITELQKKAEILAVNSNNVLNSLINGEDDLKALESSKPDCKYP